MILFYEGVQIAAKKRNLIKVSEQEVWTYYKVFQEIYETRPQQGWVLQIILECDKREGRPKIVKMFINKI